MNLNTSVQSKTGPSTSWVSNHCCDRHSLTSEFLKLFRYLSLAASINLKLVCRFLMLMLRYESHSGNALGILWYFSHQDSMNGSRLILLSHIFNVL